MPIEVNGREVMDPEQIWQAIALRVTVYRFAQGERVMRPQQDHVIDTHALRTVSPSLISPGTTLECPEDSYVSLQVDVSDDALIPRILRTRTLTGSNHELPDINLLWNVNGYQTVYVPVAHVPDRRFGLHGKSNSIRVDLTFNVDGQEVQLIWHIIMHIPCQRTARQTAPPKQTKRSERTPSPPRRFARMRCVR